MKSQTFNQLWRRSSQEQVPPPRGTKERKHYEFALAWFRQGMQYALRITPAGVDAELRRNSAKS